MKRFLILFAVLSVIGAMVFSACESNSAKARPEYEYAKVAKERIWNTLMVTRQDLVDFNANRRYVKANRRYDATMPKDTSTRTSGVFPDFPNGQMSREMREDVKL